MNAKQQNGFGIVAAIFILVVLATLAVYIVNISGSVHSATSMTQLSTRAYYAARSGVEYGVYNATHPSGAGCSASSNFTLTNGGIPFQVAVSCSATAVVEGANSYSIYDIQSTSKYGASTDFDYVTRTVSISVTDAP
jgi:MSHA biogenesis protein MshP